MRRRDRTSRRRLARALVTDPRHHQIAVLSALLAWALLGLDLEVRPGVAAAVVGAALVTQWLGVRAVGLPGFDPRSPLISSLSLTLLLRTPSPALAALAAVLAIGSKFTLRARGKHVFNPTNFGLVAVLLLSDRAWVSPGQWGSPALAAFAVAGLGLLVVWRAERSDVTWAFLGFYAALLVGRALWLGDPLAIPLHQLANGALLVFTFFMISDPKTTPDSRAGRVLFALLVALGAGFVQFELYRPAGPIWALAALAPLVPLIDRVLPGLRYRWPGLRRASGTGPTAAEHTVSPAAERPTATAPGAAAGALPAAAEPVAERSP